MLLLVTQMVKNLPAVWETRIWSLDQEDPLEKVVATHSSIVAWRIPWTEEPGRLQSMGLQRVKPDWATHTHTRNIKTKNYYLRDCFYFVILIYVLFKSMNLICMSFSILFFLLSIIKHNFKKNTKIFFIL